MRNEEVYLKSKIKPWSQKIKKQRMTWLGHLIRMPSNFPAKKAFRFCQEPFQAARGRPKLTWIKAVKDQLQSDLGLSWEQALEKAEDRKTWRNLVYDKYK